MQVQTSSLTLLVFLFVPVFLTLLFICLPIRVPGLNRGAPEEEEDGVAGRDQGGGAQKHDAPALNAVLKVNSC